MPLLLAVQQQTVWKPRVFQDRTEPLELLDFMDDDELVHCY